MGAHVKMQRDVAVADVQPQNDSRCGQIMYVANRCPLLLCKPLHTLKDHFPDRSPLDPKVHCSDRRIGFYLRLGRNRELPINPLCASSVQVIESLVKFGKKRIP